MARATLQALEKRIMDMTNVLGPNIQQSTGFTSLFIGFNGDTFDIVHHSLEAVFYLPHE